MLNDGNYADDFFVGHSKTVYDKPPYPQSAGWKKTKSSKAAAESVDARSERKFHLFARILERRRRQGSAQSIPTEIPSPHSLRRHPRR